MNDPFDYVPHPQCVEAAQRLRHMVMQHPLMAADAAQGKMMGVLWACDAQGAQHWLYAYSGLLAGRNDWPGFVPPVFDAQQPDGHFKQEEACITALNARIAACEDSDEVARMKAERRERSIALQQWLHDQYRLLNAKGEEKSVAELFACTPQRVAPGGTGDCCAPKLLQDAYRRGWTPVSIAEFWMGKSPVKEIRRDGAFYPACKGKCGPLLPWMLQGVDVEWTVQREEVVNERPHIVYEDAWMVVLDKPSGMLSVPGRKVAACAESWAREHLHEEVLRAAHRLDRDTSGLLILARDEDTYKALQRAFALGQVHKRYEAIVECAVPEGERDGIGTLGGHPQEGVVTLPLAPDFMHRPCQMVDMEAGKPAVTRYRVMGTAGQGRWRLSLWPETGRTHQLRVHCAHPSGLNAPIQGDALYGNRSQRLMLHAAQVELLHPATGEPLSLQCPVPF